jgi:hypothetical protein
MTLTIFGYHSCVTFHWYETKPVEDKSVLDNNAIHPPTLVHKKAIQLKEEGNAFFKEKNFDAAIAKYTEAILLDPQNAGL